MSNVALHFDHNFKTQNHNERLLIYNDVVARVNFSSRFTVLLFRLGLKNGES